MQTAMSMAVVPVQAPRVTRASLQRPAARTASFQARTVSNGATTKQMMVRTMAACAVTALPDLCVEVWEARPLSARVVSLGRWHTLAC